MADIEQQLSKLERDFKNHVHSGADTRRIGVENIDTLGLANYVNRDGSSTYTATGAGFKDEDNMASDSATATASQQSIKAYADTKLANVVEDTTPQLGGNLDVNGKDITSPDGTDLIDIVNGTIDIKTNSSSRVDITDSGVRLGGANARVTTVLDEDAMGSDSATALATQQSIKAYVDANTGVPSPHYITVVDNGWDGYTNFYRKIGFYHKGGDSAQITLSGSAAQTGSATAKYAYARYDIVSDVGHSLVNSKRGERDFGGTTLNAFGVLMVGDNEWISSNFADGDYVYKNGTAQTFDSTTAGGALTWDNTNSYLCVQNAPTSIVRFTENTPPDNILDVVDTITLSTTPSADLGYVYDDDNEMFYILDTANNLIRKYNTSGTQQSTTSYTNIDGAIELGCVLIDGRIYIVYEGGSGEADTGMGGLSVSIVPTTLTV